MDPATPSPEAPHIKSDAMHRQPDEDSGSHANPEAPSSPLPEPVTRVCVSYLNPAAHPVCIPSHHDLELQLTAVNEQEPDRHTGVFSRTVPFWRVTVQLRERLKEQFERYDIDESGWIDSEAEINLLASNVAYMAFNEPFNLEVGTKEIDQLVSLSMSMMDQGLNEILFQNLIVCIYGFQLSDGSYPDKDPMTLKAGVGPAAVAEEKGHPYGDPQLDGFVEWWENDPETNYGPHYLHKHPGDGLNGHDEVTEQILERAKLEYKCAMVRHGWEMKRAKNMMEWRRCICEDLDISKCQSEEDHLVFEIKNAKMHEKLARKERNRIGLNVLWMEGASCISDDTIVWQFCSKLRSDPAWQWFMLAINLVNVVGLMSDDTSCDPPDCSNPYQNDLLPVLDMLANLLFTIDMVVAMIVLGFKSYFDNTFLILDFTVVLTGWIDAFDMLGGLDVSALRALRVLRPMRLIKYFKGIQAIIGAIYFNIEPIWNVITFMLFFLIIFGIAGITLFPGQMQHRCVISGPYGSQTAGVLYDDDYAALDDAAEMGEFEYFCTVDTERISYPFPYRCASYMTCDENYGNPHHGATHFDNFGAAFLLMFQVQTLSTYYEYDYYTQMTSGWYTTIYYNLIIFLVGFIVSQLFIAVVCFGFECLSEQLEEPEFSDAVIGLPYVERESDPEDNLCRCLNKPINPLEGAKKKELDRGDRTGFCVKINFAYHYYAPVPLNKVGAFEPLEEVTENPFFEAEPNAVGVALSSEPTHRSTGSDESETNPLSPTSTSRISKMESVLGIPHIQKLPEQQYAEYRALMQQWKDEAAAEEDARVNGPFMTAQCTETPRELDFRYRALSTWSNERVFSLHVMLRAQEMVDRDNETVFYHDDCGQPGKPMENELLSDLVTVYNDTDMPELTVHVRSFVKVVVEPLTNPRCQLPVFSLIGNETIGEVKRMSFEYIKEQRVLPESVELEHCQLYVGGDVLAEDNASLFSVCLTAYDDDFDPMADEVFFAMTIDKNETFILSELFDNGVIAIICLNSITLSIDHYGASDGFTTFLEVVEWIFNVIFTFEMFIKFYCLKGFGNYWRFGSNQFDFMIVVSSWLNVLTESVGLDLAFIKVLRIFRALRVTRVLRKIKSVREIIDAAFNSMQPILNIMMFMLVVLVVYSCMGMQLYGSAFIWEDEDEVPRENFDNFVMAFLSLFQVLTGSAWELVLYDCMRANKNSYLGVPFILSFFILSNYIILNLFIGAILANMGTGTDEDRLEMTTDRKLTEIRRQRLARESQLFVNNCLSTASALDKLDDDLTTLEQVMQQRCAKGTFVSSPIEGTRFGMEITNVALGFFPPQSSFRRSIYKLVSNPYFDIAILLVIVYSTILLTLLNPDTVRDDGWKSFFHTNDVIFLIIFTIEFLLKLIAYGFIWCDNTEFMLANETDLKELMLGDHGIPAYMYDSWNYLDIIVLVVSYLNMFGDPEGPLKILRLLRAFRPLRMVNRIDGMKTVIMSLVLAAPALSNVCVLLFAVFLIFGILGLSLFMGKFQACTDGESNKANCYGTADGDDFLVPTVFMNPALDGFGHCSFDNIWDAFMSLFEVASGDSWETVMYLMADIPKEAGQAPYRDDGPLSNCLWAFFCVIFVFMGQLFMMQLFVSVIIDSFSEVEGSGLLTADQQIVNDMQKYFIQLTPEQKPPVHCAVPGGWRANFYYIFTNIRPLPVPEMQECLDRDHVPKTRFVADSLSVRRQIEVTKQSIKKKREEPELVEKMTKTLQILQSSYDEKMDNIRLLEAFSMEKLADQTLPAGCLYISGSWFDQVLTTCIITNIMFMCTVHHNQIDAWTDFVYYQNLVFLIIFTIEMIIKWIGLGCKAYWTSPFDAFDGFTVLLGWVFVVVDLGAIAGIFRIGRVFRLVKRAPKLQNLMSTLVYTLPSISNVFMVLLLVFFIFAVIGVELFGKVRYGFSLNVVANMGTWSASMHMLWRAALGNWRGGMYDSMVSAPDCTMTMDGFPDSEMPDGSKYNDCGDYFTSCVFFVFFQVVATFCVLNLVVAIILNAFTWCYSLEPSEITAGLKVNSQHLLHFKEIWMRFDLFGTGFIDLEQLQLLMAVVQYQVSELCGDAGKILLAFFSDTVNQRDELIYTDFSSFGSGPGGTDRDGTEAQCRRNYTDLVKKITKYERALDVSNRLVEEDINIQNGDNTFIFNAKIDNGVMFAEENSEESDLYKVRYSTLMMIILMKAVGLSEHDQYVCNSYRDPFRYRVLGYRETEINDGRIETPEKDYDSSQPSSRPISPVFYPDPPSFDKVDVYSNGLAQTKDDIELSPRANQLPKHDMMDDYTPPLPSSKISLHLNPSLPDQDLSPTKPHRQEDVACFGQKRPESPTSSLDGGTDKLESALSEIAGLKAQLKNQALDQEMKVDIAAEAFPIIADIGTSAGHEAATLEVGRREQWIDKKREECEMYFERYDLDDSGTLNDPEELKYLGINLVRANELSLSIEQMNELLKPAMAHIEFGGTYTLEEFMIWFYDEMICHVPEHISL